MRFVRIVCCAFAFSAPALAWAEERRGTQSPAEEWRADERRGTQSPESWSLDTTGLYLGGGQGRFSWSDVTATGGGGEDYLVEYDDSQGFHAILGNTSISRLFRFRYELEAYRQEADLTIKETNGTVYTGGTAEVTGVGVSLFYDFPALFGGHLSPYLGGGGLAMLWDIDLPSGVAPPNSMSAEGDCQSEDIPDGFIEEACEKGVFGYHLAAGFRIELTSLIGIDVGGRLVRPVVNYSDIRGEEELQGAIAFGGEAASEFRASLIVRF